MSELSDFLDRAFESDGRGGQAKFSRKTGASDGAVSKWRQGARAPDFYFCLHIAKYFGLDPVEVFRMAGKPEFGELYRFVAKVVQSAPVPDQQLPAESPEPLGLTGRYRDLQRILEEAPEEDRRFIETAIDLVVSRIPAKKPARVLPHRPRQPVVTVGRLSDLEDEHDEPQPVHTAELPYFEYRVPAGPPDEVEADGYQTIEVLRHLVKESRYVVRVAGDSMEPEIRNGDLILVDYAEQPRNGKIVCALINGKGTVKEFHKRGSRIVLKPKNPKHEDITVKESDDFRVQGVVKGIVNRRIG